MLWGQIFFFRQSQKKKKMIFLFFCFFTFFFSGAFPKISDSATKSLAVDSTGHNERGSIIKR